jgi:AbiV family abortive infection protein
MASGPTISWHCRASSHAEARGLAGPRVGQFREARESPGRGHRAITSATDWSTCEPHPRQDEPPGCPNQKGLIMPTKRLPTPSEARIGAEVAADNASELLRAADALAAESLYGPATSLAELAFEESVKARALMAIFATGGRGPALGFSEAELHGIIYSSHRLRHGAGLLQDMQSALIPMMLGQMPSPSEQQRLADAARILATANDAKQQGFYVDFDESSAVWSAPNEITKQQYAEFREFSGRFTDETIRQVRSLP